MQNSSSVIDLTDGEEDDLQQHQAYTGEQKRRKLTNDNFEQTAQKYPWSSSATKVTPRNNAASASFSNLTKAFDDQRSAQPLPQHQTPQPVRHFPATSSLPTTLPRGTVPLKQEPPRSDAGAGFIDLTENDEDDSDVYVDEEATSRTVCFGMIKTMVMVHVPIEFPVKEGMEIMLLKREPTEKFPLAVRVNRQNGALFGYADANLAGPALAELMDQRLIGIDARIPRTTDPKFVVWLYVTLYGKPAASKSVSNAFARQNVAIQDPLFYDSKTYRYVNPHVAYNVRLSKTSYDKGPVRTAKDAKSQIDEVFKSLQSPEDLPETDPDKRLTAKLYKHQKQALYFMTEREKLPNYRATGKNKQNLLWRVKERDGYFVYINLITGSEEIHEPSPLLGGILADDMGLGKTIAVICLVLNSLGKRASTLSAFEMKHQQDLARAASRSGGVAPDIVGNQLETLSDDESIGAVMATPTQDRGRGGTLIVCPLSTVSNWEEQFSMHVAPNAVSIYVFHGNNRTADLNFLTKHDVVITTYNVLGSDFSKQEKASKTLSTPRPSCLQQVSWFRVVLDEAHMIKDTTTIQSKAACALTADRRWSLTGTPIQNKLDDLFAQVRFLRIEPLSDRLQWNNLISKPLKNQEPVALSRLQTLMRCITLRRTKTQTLDGKPILELPPREDDIRLLKFDTQEQSLYDKMVNHATSTVKLLLKENTVMKNYVHILQAILRLRQICVHTALCDLSHLKDDTNVPLAVQNTPAHALEAYNLLKESGNDQCTICAGDAQQPFWSRCDHLFCADCILPAVKDHETAGGVFICPDCRLDIRQGDLIDLKNCDVKDESAADAQAAAKIRDSPSHSTKVRALIEDLLRHKYSPMGNPGKSIVFSQWTSNLDLIEKALNEAKIVFVRLDGRMLRNERNVSIERLKNDPVVSVMLISLKAGGVGLNLTCAQRVYLMDPYWNPSVEFQAIDRVHRMGQTEKVTCVRFIIENTIEEKMLQMQERKLELSNMTFGKPSKSDIQKRRLDDIKFLVFDKTPESKESQSKPAAIAPRPPHKVLQQQPSKIASPEEIQRRIRAAPPLQPQPNHPSVHPPHQNLHPNLQQHQSHYHESQYHQPQYHQLHNLNQQPTAQPRNAYRVPQQSNDQFITPHPPLPRTTSHPQTPLPHRPQPRMSVDSQHPTFRVQSLDQPQSHQDSQQHHLNEEPFDEIVVPDDIDWNRSVQYSENSSSELCTGDAQDQPHPSCPENAASHLPPLPKTIAALSPAELYLAQIRGSQSMANPPPPSAHPPSKSSISPRGSPRIATPHSSDLDDVPKKPSGTPHVVPDDDLEHPGHSASGSYVQLGGHRYYTSANPAANASVTTSDERSGDLNRTSPPPALADYTPGLVTETSIPDSLSGIDVASPSDTLASPAMAAHAVDGSSIAGWDPASENLQRSALAALAALAKQSKAKAKSRIGAARAGKPSETTNVHTPTPPPP